MLKNTIPFLLTLGIFVGLASGAFAQIIVEEAGVIWEQPHEIPAEVPAIPPRIVCEYVTTMHHQEIICPEELLDVTSFVPSRIIVEYATTIAHLGLNKVTVCDWSDLCVFAADFGRTDCDTGELCENDYDGDGDVDGFDLAEFSANF